MLEQILLQIVKPLSYLRESKDMHICMYKFYQKYTENPYREITWNFIKKNSMVNIIKKNNHNCFSFKETLIWLTKKYIK